MRAALLALLLTAGCAVIQEYDEKGRLERTVLTPAVVAYTPRAPVVSIQGAGLVFTPFSISMGLYKMTVMTPHAECSAVVMIDNVEAAVAWQGYLKDVDFMCPKEGPK